VHASGESSTGDIESGTYAVVLTVPNERDLVQLADELRRKSVSFVAIFEPDSPMDGAMTAIGLKPGRKGDLRRHLSSLPLLR
jgi:hypothetical protein